jgi:flagellar basal body-associated protein FliL
MNADFNAPVSPMQEPPKKNNTMIIIIVVVVVLLCCCCVGGILAWNYGDMLLDALNMY